MPLQSQSYLVMSEQVVLVDAHDNEVGVMEKMQAHYEAKLHRAISVFILNSEGNWLIHKRAAVKYHSPNLWTNTCCTHPMPQESYLAAANRRLQFEMGLQTDLVKVWDFIYKAELGNGLTEHELDYVFVGQTDDIPQMNPDEVAEYRYLSRQEIADEIDQNPENYTVWFREIFDKVQNKIIL